MGERWVLMLWMWFFRMMLVWAVPLVLLFVIWLGASRHRRARELGEGRVEFTLERRTFWAWLVMVAYLLYVIVLQLVISGGHALPLVFAVFFGACAVILIADFPATITAGPDGLEQVAWFWLKRKRIAWDEIKEIRADKKNRDLTIVGAKGTKIQFMRQLPDRDRLLEEMRKHCRDNMPQELLPASTPVMEG